MPRSENENVPGKRLVLGFDGGCSVCGELARRIEGELGGRLGVISLDDPRALKWREKALGEDAPWAPTLFEVDGDEVRAWTGKQMGLKLSLSLGPAHTGRVMREIGKMAAGGGMSRRRFLKAVGGAMVAAGALTGGGLVPPAAAQSNSNTQSTIVQVARTRNEVVGASIAHPKNQTPVREEYTFDETYGFTLWTPDSSDEDHGGEPVVRVALAYGLKPGQIQSRVQERVSAFSDVPEMKVERLPVGEKKYKSTAVGPIPGSTPSTEVYVPVEGRVYQINVYEPRLSAEGRRLLSSVRFERPSRSADSFGKLSDGKKAETYQKGDTEFTEREKAARKAARVVLPEGVNGTPRTGNLSASIPGLAEYETLEAAGPLETENLAAPAYVNEYRIGEGCWVPTSTFFFQTQHGAYANRRWGASWTGWTLLGQPNYWGQYTHGSYGYGRCASTYYCNDMYAIDYPLQAGDVVFSPFTGTVTFAGRNYSHANYGIFVTIRADNNKYVNMSAHLSSLGSGIRRGARVSTNSIIGLAGATGHPSVPVGETHLHQAYYRYPGFKPDGSPYGGNGLKVVYHRYTGTAARKAGYRVSSYNPYYNVYNLDYVAPSYYRRCYEGIKCGEGYAISN